MTSILDPVADFAIAPITNTPLTSSATSFTLADQAGDISAFDDPGALGYYAVVWPRDPTHPHPGDAFRASLAEIVRVTSRNVPGQSLTVTRAQLGTTALNLNLTGVTYWLMAGMNSDVIEKIDARIFDQVSGRLETSKEVRVNDLLRVVNGGTPNVVTDAVIHAVNGAAAGDNATISLQSGTTGSSTMALGTTGDGDVCEMTYNASSLAFDISFLGSQVFLLPVIGRAAINRAVDVIQSGTAVAATDEAMRVVNSTASTTDCTIGVQSGTDGISGIRLGHSTDKNRTTILLDNDNNDTTFTAGEDLIFNANPSLFYQIAGVTKLRMGSAGVSVGSNAPAHPLDVTGASRFNGTIATQAGTTLSIASGAATVTNAFHRIRGAASAADDLDTLNGGTIDGQIVILQLQNGVGTVSVRDAIDNIYVDAVERDLTNRSRLVLQYDSGLDEWHEVSYAANT